MKTKTLIIGLMAVSSIICTGCKGNNTTETPKGNGTEIKDTIPAGSIVYFNLDRVLQEYDMANDRRSEVETKIEAIQQDVARRQKNLENKANDLQTKFNKGLMTSAVAAQKQQELQEQGVAFQQYAQQKEAEIMEEQQVLMNTLADAIKTYVDAFNAEKGYAMIIGNQANVPVVSGDPKLDITDEIIAGLNAKYVEDKKQSAE